MSVAKIIEVVSEGSSIENAVDNAIAEASKTIKNIRGMNVTNFHAVVENNKVKKYRIDAKIAFVVEQS